MSIILNTSLTVFGAPEALAGFARQVRREAPFVKRLPARHARALRLWDRACIAVANGPKTDTLHRRVPRWAAAHPELEFFVDTLWDLTVIEALFARGRCMALCRSELAETDPPGVELGRRDSALTGNRRAFRQARVRVRAARPGRPPRPQRRAFGADEFASDR
jgi:hypothetical protein